MAKGRREYSPEELLFQQALGATIRRLRTEAGLNQEEFAARAQLERSYIPRLEDGKFDPRTSTLTRVAECLGIEVDQFMHLIVVRARELGVPTGIRPEKITQEP